MWRSKGKLHWTALMCTISLTDTPHRHIYKHVYVCKQAHIWFPRDAATKNYKLDGLKQQQFILSQFGKLEVCNPGVSGALLSMKPLGTDSSWSLPASVSLEIPRLWLHDSNFSLYLAFGLTTILLRIQLISSG